MSSLQDQLLQAGLVDGKKAKQTAKEKRKQAKAAKHNKGAVDEAEQARQQAKADKIARDKALNKARDARLEEKAIAAQIIQLVAQHRQPKYVRGEEIEFHFSDGKQIKKVRLDAKVNREVVRGQLAIARFEGGYELIPRVIAEKIEQRDPACIVVLNRGDQTEAAVEEDPYKDYPIPDDLMW